MKLNEEIASYLLKIQAVSLNVSEPYTWASGLRSPIYCDNRLTMAYPEVRNRIAQGFAEKICEQYPECEGIVGTATAGIPHAAWVSSLLNLPMAYVRSKPKDHGRGNQIEGRVERGQKVVVIEDLISTGGSVLSTTHALQEAGAEILAVFAIFTYQLEVAEEAFKNESFPVQTLTDYQTLIDVATNIGDISPEQGELLSRWREDPQNWYHLFYEKL